MQSAARPKKRPVMSRVKLEEFDDLVADSKSIAQAPILNPPRKRRTASKQKQANSSKNTSTVSNMSANNSCRLSSTFQQQPEDIDELVVNTKKINEVRNWLRQKINANDDKKCLLITGPSGCGKSSTVRLLCDELDVDLIEFESEHRFDMREDWDTVSQLYDEAQINQFRDFILTSQVKTVESCSRTRKLIIVKELPAVFISDPKLFFNFLHETIPTLKAFLVFSITSVDTTYDLSTNRLFPEIILQQLKIHQIKFNAIPRTTMTKLVNSWVSCLGVAKNAAFTNSIVDKADGDIRSAMSLMEMCCVDKRLVNLEFLSTPNPTLDLFRFLGKIIYAKRLDVADEKWALTENRLQESVKDEYRREFPPKEDPNVLAKSSFLSDSAVTDFVTEHEPYFCKDPKVLSRVYEDICQTSMLSSPFALRIDPVVQAISRQITIRSVIFNNHMAKKNLGMYKFSKSTSADLKSKCDMLMKELNSVFPATGLVDTTTFTIPLLSKLGTFVTEEQAHLCDNLNPKSKINPKRVSLVAINRPTFQICNDSD